MKPKPRMGRPRKPLSEKYVKVTVSLPPQVAAIAKLLGGGGTTKNTNLPAIRKGIIYAVEHAIVFVPDKK